MTKEEEAIARIKDHMIVHKMHEPRAVYISEALDMAIKALSQEPTVQDKQAESEKYQKAFDDGYANGYAQARFDYEQEPQCTEHPCLGTLCRYYKEPCDDAWDKK